MDDPFWAVAPDELVRMRSAPGGLSAVEAAARLARVGPNAPPEARDRPIRALVRQLLSPLMLLLAGAATVSAAVGEWLDAGIVLSIVLASALLGFVQERRASRAIAALRERVRSTARVIRDGREVTVPTAEVVPGDRVVLGVGSILPGDGVFLEAHVCHVDEAALTGETFPVEKRPGAVPAETPLAGRSGAGWMGTSVTTGTATFLVLRTGAATEAGAIAAAFEREAPPTAFERGVRDFGVLVTRAMGVLVGVVFVVLVAVDHQPVEALLFGTALAVGLAPELLPAILAINLARGARSMAARGVLVRRLSAIEDFGAMEILCTDKTGTLTVGEVRLDGAVDLEGRPDPEVLRLAARNARLQRGLPNPLDAALVAAAPPEDAVTRLAEIPYDFVRKRLSVVLRAAEGEVLVTKGAVEPVLAVCTQAAGRPLDAAARAGLLARFEAHCVAGRRVLAVAVRPADPQPTWAIADERDLDLRGFLLFLDPPKPGAARTLATLQELGVELKVVSGDNRFAVAHVAGRLGLPASRVVTGADVAACDDVALADLAARTTLFAETDPAQKARILGALRARGRTVGFMGDGVNDAPSLHAADVGISVEGAVDVAREAADLVLVERDLAVLAGGILEGRRIFANTLKYVLTTESANLGNMLSMAAASLFLPFLPLLPKQILLNNFLSDFPAMALASDRVDAEQLRRPVQWDMHRIASFMLVFGLVSAGFDALTFALLLRVFAADAPTFRTGWFIESLLTELAVALVVRTRLPAWRSRPGAALVGISVGVGVLTFALPFLPGASLLGFVPLSPALLGTLAGVTVAYVAAVEVTKRGYYRWAA